MLEKSGERVFPDQFENLDEYLVFLRHLFAYEHVVHSIERHDSLLELGCGEGYGTSLLSGYCKTITGLDVHEESLNHAVGRYESENCKFRLYDGSAIPFPDESFDKAVLFQVIEHVEDDSGFLREIARVLKPGGTLFLTTPSRSYRLKPGQKPWNPYHIREYTHRELLGVMKKSFSSVEIKGIRASDEVQELEFRRVEKNHKLSSILIRKSPKVLKDGFKKLFKNADDDKTPDYMPDVILRRFSTDDFYLIEDEIDTYAIDLLGISIK
jgi:ubiquinone/menaquinone biosynthesis C-methylase UbiE